MTVHGARPDASRNAGSQARRKTRSGRTAWVRKWLPPQHGAWAMLVLPYLAGVIAGGFRWIHVPLLLAWLLGYLGSYFVFLALKSRRPGRYRTQMAGYLIPAGLLATVVVVAEPVVLLAAPAFVGCWAVNAWYAWRRNDRSLVNDLVAVALASAVGPVAYWLGDGRDLRAAVIVGAVPFLYFAGTVFFVKTMIRERGSALYYWLSVAFHGVAALVAFAVHPLLGIVFLALLVRAGVWPKVGATPLQIGLVEIGASVLVLISTVIAT